MNYLVYVVFNKDQGIYNELVYSVLSLNHVSGLWAEKNLTVLIYSVEEIAIPEGRIPVRFKKVEEQVVTDHIAQAHGCGFVMKAVALKNIVDEVKDEDNVLYVDTDTFFRDDPKDLFEQIASGSLILHMQEQVVKNRPVIHRFLTSHSFHSSKGQPFKVTGNFTIWNSGAIGLNRSFKDVLPEIIVFIGQMAKEVKWHVIDQLAFSYFFNSYNIVSAEKFIVHYWFNTLTYYLTARYFNYYRDEDIVLWLNEYDHEIPIPLRYEDIPSLAVQLLSVHGFLLDTHFLDLPAGTFIGDLFRQHATGVRIMPYSAPY